MAPVGFVQTFPEAVPQLVGVVVAPLPTPPHEDVAGRGDADEASDAEVEQAYRRLIGQYHPDRLQGAAPELQRQAEAKARELNAAYDRIKTLRKQ